MASVEIRIPQLGEGLHEARIVRFLKQPGESVTRDEPIYEMETDKAVMEIESPSAGILESWSANEDDVLPIGTVVGRLATEVEAEHDRQRGLLGNAHVPPRTRAYAREKGVPEEVLAQLASHADGKLMPQAVDAYLQGLRDAGISPPLPDSAAAKKTGLRQDASEFVDVELPQRQRTLNYRLQRSAQVVIPATLEMTLDWSGVETARAQIKALPYEEMHRSATQFLLFAWCVAQAAKEHPAFRSALVSDTTVREYAHLHLGIAVARPGDELLMARLPDADTLSLDEFARTAHEAIERARNGEDQSSDAMQISLTNMAGEGVRLGIPVVAAPAVGTLFIGAPYDQAYANADGGVGFRRQANMVFTFDHRIANGIGAARFLGDIRARVDDISKRIKDEG